jgi:hypothetical protein
MTYLKISLYRSGNLRRKKKRKLNTMVGMGRSGFHTRNSSIHTRALSISAVGRRVGSSHRKQKDNAYLERKRENIDVRP